MTDAAKRTNTDVPVSWRIWTDLFGLFMVVAALFMALLIVWFLAHPVAHMAADIKQRWENGWQEGLNDGPD